MSIKIQEAYSTLNRMDQKKKSSHHRITKKTKHTKQRKTIKNCEGKNVTYKCRPIRITTDFSMQSLKDRRTWKDILHTKKSQKPDQTTMCLGNFSITIDGENKIHSNLNNINLQIHPSGKCQRENANYTFFFKEGKHIYTYTHTNNDNNDKITTISSP